jgi:CBS domain containing-hemolysin-like protein
VSFEQILLMVVLLAANAFFVAFEFALVASRRTRLDQRVQAGSRAAVRAVAATKNLGEHIAAVQLGVAVASLGLGAVAEPAVGHAFNNLFGRWLPQGTAHALGFITALAIVVFLHTVFGEMVPKNVALAKAESALVTLAWPMHIFLRCFGPLIRALDAVANAVLRLLRVEKRDELFSGGTAEEIARLLRVSHQHGMIAGDQADILAGAIAFADRRVSDVMLPIAEVHTLPAGCLVADAVRQFAESGHSRLPVVGRHGDLIGFIHAKDVVAASAGDMSRPLKAGIIRRMLVVDDTSSLDDLLVDMRRSRVQVALVTDANRTSVGIATLEDLLEELVGEIADETDVEPRSP